MTDNEYSPYIRVKKGTRKAFNDSLAKVMGEIGKPRLTQDEFIQILLAALKTFPLNHLKIGLDCGHSLEKCLAAETA